MKHLALVMLLAVSTGALASRELQSLEAFDLASVNLVRVVGSKAVGTPYALIRDPNCRLHRAFRGDYIGTAGALVRQVRRDGLTLRVPYLDQSGEWQVRVEVMRIGETNASCQRQMDLEK